MTKMIPEIVLGLLVILVVSIVILPIVFDKPPVRYNEEEVIFDGYTIVGFICYKCNTSFEPGGGEYLSGHIYCALCAEALEEFLDG